MPADITSSTLIALTLTETMGVLVFIATVLVGVIAFVRKDERDTIRLNQNESQGADNKKDIATLTATVNQLTRQIERLLGEVEALRGQRNRTPKPTNPPPR